MHESIIYSYVTKVLLLKCQKKSEFVIYLNATKNCEGNATVRISIEDLPILKYEVKLYDLPQDGDSGHEVTVNFHSDLKNNGTFYTDSNGLEM